MPKTNNLNIDNVMNEQASIKHAERFKRAGRVQQTQMTFRIPDNIYAQFKEGCHIMRETNGGAFMEIWEFYLRNHPKLQREIADNIRNTDY